MSEWYDNQSAEVVLRQLPDRGAERKYLDGCMKRLKRRERALILRIADPDPIHEKAHLGVSAAEKKIRARLVTCFRKCVAETERQRLILPSVTS